MSVNNEEYKDIPRYWGIYFPETGLWYRTSTGEVCHYPSPYIAAAALATAQRDWITERPAMEVKEFTAKEKAMSAR
jgi:hypothetical protein